MRLAKLLTYSTNTYKHSTSTRSTEGGTMCAFATRDAAATATVVDAPVVDTVPLRVDERCRRER